MRCEILPADRTMVIDLQEGAKQFAFAATGAAAAQSAFQRGPHVALFSGGGIPGPDLGCGAHGFHDLPFCDLPDFPLPDLALPNFAFPGLRSFLRGLRPGCALACVTAPSRAPSRLRPRGITRPPDKSSTRNAPATGAASTRPTSTTPPSRRMAPLREPASPWRWSY